MQFDVKAARATYSDATRHNMPFAPGSQCREHLGPVSAGPKPLPFRSEAEVMSTWEASGKPLVTVWCVTFNHAPYIEDALRGFLGQVTSFPFEIVIRDDASTDGTSDVVRRYASLFPNIVHAIIETENQWAKNTNAQVLMSATRGDFIALCDGDDYWTSAEKLARQIAQLQADPGLSMTVHGVYVVDPHGVELDVKMYNLVPGPRLDFHEILDFHSIPTPGLLFRVSCLPAIPEWFREVRSIDIAMELLLASKGDCHYDHQKLAAYRVHDGGVTRKEKFSPVEYEQFARALYEGIDTHTEGRYRGILQRKIALSNLVCSVGLLRRGQGRDAVRYLWRAMCAHPFVVFTPLRRRWQQWRRRRLSHDRS
jgi:glycosyltransferase involved in cell wall biosynthesis